MFLSLFKAIIFYISPMLKSNMSKHTSFLKENKIIYIYPGGLKGFYYLGIANFIRDNYELDNWSFLGASAGSWVSLFMSYKGDPLYFLNKTGIFTEDFMKVKNMKKMKIIIKNNILYNFNESDFNLSKINIGLVHLNLFGTSKHIYSNFYSLEDVIDCCISSSHIPIISGNLIQKYKGIYVLDGGSRGFPYTDSEYLNTNDNTNTSFHIHENIWINKSKNQNIIKSLKSTLFDTHILNIDKYNFKALYEKGYNDAKKNKKYLETIFIPLIK